MNFMVSDNPIRREKRATYVAGTRMSVSATKTICSEAAISHLIQKNSTTRVSVEVWFGDSLPVPRSRGSPSRGGGRRQRWRRGRRQVQS